MQIAITVALLAAAASAIPLAPGYDAAGYAAPVYVLQITQLMNKISELIKSYPHVGPHAIHLRIQRQG